MDHIAIDTAQSFPTSCQGNNILLIIICVHSRFCFLRALKDKSAASVAMALFFTFCDFGFPRIIQSDNGPEFVNQLVELMTKNVGIDHRLTTAYHPRANGMAERTVQTACRAIRKLLDNEDRQWDHFVPAVQLFKNSKIAAFHGGSFFRNVRT
jgi:transposase InsO family protein